MYIAINKTKNTHTIYEGSFPSTVLEQDLNNGDKIIVISYYSNTIKIPYSTEMNGIMEWEWEDYNMP
jgi:hypothetical protein